MHATNQVTTLLSARILRGQRAWAKIKATAAEQRQLWREVGEALVELARKTDPMHEVPATEQSRREQQVSILNMKVAEVVAQLRVLQQAAPSSPVSREVVIALFDDLCDRLGMA